MSKNIILTNQEIEHKIKRIAYQIETFVDEKEVVLAGIASNGFVLQKIAKELQNISNLQVSLCVKINKPNPELPIHTSLTKEAYANKGLTRR
jgi:pyrimidine operon attenuation protein/uracil phosphoribosyltransferase